MADNKFSSDDIQKIPNSVSGDGRTFVAQLKKALLKFAGNVSSGVSEAIENTSTAYGQATGITLLEEHVTDDLGYPENDVYVTWEKGTVTGYSGASVWYKAGTTGQYQYAGNANGVTYTVKKLTAGTTYTIKVVAINKFGISCDFDAAPTADITVQGSSHLPTAPDQFTVTWEGGTPHWQWTAVNTEDYFDGYELRENTDAGKYKGMLDSTTALASDAAPSQRSGTAYLFTRSIFGQYGSPRTHAYNLAQPTAPTAPVIETLFQGFNIHMAALPANCTGIEILATNTSTKDEHSFYTKNDVFQIGILNGNYDFKYRYYDCFGNGEWSNVTNADVTRVIDSSLIGDNAVTADKIISGAITTDKISAGAVTTEKLLAGAVTADKIGAYAVTADKIQSGSVTTDKLSANAVTAEKLAAESVTADKIISGAITTEKIAAGSVTAGKIGAGNITLSDTLTISAGKVTLDGNGLKLLLSDNSYTLFNSDGINYIDSNGVEYASVTKMIIGKAYDGQYVKFAAPWAVPPSVLTVPMSIQTNAMGYDNVNTYIVCEPTEVTANGFRVNNYLRLQSGAYSNVKANIEKKWTSTENFGYTDVRVDGYMVLMDFWQDAFTVTIPASATHFEVPVSFSYGTRWDSHTSTYDDGSTKTTYFMQWGDLRLVHLKDTRYHHVDGWHQIGLQLIVDGETKSTVWSSSVTNYTANTINTTLSATFDQSSQPRTVKIRTIWKGQVRHTYGNGQMQDDVNTINADRNKAAMCWAHLSNLTIPSYKFQSGEAKIARGYAMFLVTDGGTNNYTITD